MIKVLITKQNEGFFRNLGITNFKEATKNTCFFKCSEIKFLSIRNELRKNGINPYSVMSW